MAVGLCARCNKRSECEYRQPGTWVDECGLFDPSRPRAKLAFPSQRLSPGQPDGRSPLAGMLARSQSV